MPSTEIVLGIYTQILRKNPLNKGKELNDCLCKAARSTYLEKFVDAMNEMKALSTAAHQWFQEKYHSQWSKSLFNNSQV